MIQPDSPTLKDKLKRKPLAQQISESLLYSFQNNVDSIVVGLTGVWGSGKSTMLDFIRMELQESIKKQELEGHIIYTFNPWSFSNQVDLQTSFLLGLMRAFKDVNHEINSFLRQILEAVKQTKYLTSLIPGVKEAHEITEKLLNGIVKEKSLDELRKEIDTLIIKKNIRLFVFIDDLDRLTPDEILEIFQLVKLNASFKNTFFVMAFDKRIITQALVKKYGEFGATYLDKIVQVDFPVPEILEEDISEIFFSELETFLNEQNISFAIKNLEKAWYYHGLKMYFQTIRQIKRYINALHFRFTNIYPEVNILDYLLLEAIRIFDPIGYRKIYIDAEMIGTRRVSQGYSKGSKSIEEFDHEATRLILAYLSGKSVKYQYHYETDKGVFDSRFFERYFTMQIANSDVSEQEVADFRNGESNRRSILYEVYKSNRLTYFFKRLADSRLLIPIKELPNALTSVLEFMNSKREAINNSGNAFLKMVFNQCLEKKQLPDGPEVLFGKLRVGRTSLNRAQILLINVLLSEIEKPTGFIPKERLPFFSSRQEVLSDSLREQIDSWLDSIIRSPQQELAIFSITLRWGNKFFPEKIEKSLDELFEYPDKFVAFLQYFVMIDQDGVPGMLNLTPLYTILPQNRFQGFLAAIEGTNIDLVHETRKSTLLLFRERIEEVRTKLL